MPDQPGSTPQPHDPWALPSSPPIAGSDWTAPGGPPTPPSGPSNPGWSPPATPGWPPPAAPGWGPPGTPGTPGWAPLATPGTPGWRPPTPPAKKRHTALFLTLGILGTAMVVIVIAATVLVFSIKSGGSYPESWDPRVEFAVRFVEKEKGAPFKHPVSVEFLAVPEFEKAVSSSDTEPTADERKDADQQAAVLRILGLIEGRVDLIDEERNLVGKGAAAYYTPIDEAVKVRGTEIDEFMRATIVHELTHAWQDQHYDLLRDDLDDEGQSALRALAEGDAQNVEAVWIDGMSATEQRAYDSQQEALVNEAEQGLSKVPDVLVSAFSAPYSLGEYFLKGLDAEGGDTAVNKVFADPPTAINQILEPWTYLAGDRGVADVKAPRPVEGGEVVDEGQLGALLLYLTLADRIEPRDAMAAADAWKGDAYEVTEKDGKVCMAARIEAVDAKGGDDLQRAVRDWAGKLDHLRVEDDGDGVTFTGCDPGVDADLDLDTRSRESMLLPVLRVVLWSEALKRGESPKRARCTGEAVGDNFTEADLDESFDAARAQEIRAAAAAAC